MNPSLKQRKDFMTRQSTGSDGDSYSNSSCPEKLVTFAATAKLRRYQKDTSVDPATMWYSVSDYRQFRLERQIDAARMAGRRPVDIDEDIECFWGLENWIVPNLVEKIMDTRARVRTVVLAGQYKNDPESLSKASIFHSQWSADVARKKALFYSSHL